MRLLLLSALMAIAPSSISNKATHVYICTGPKSETYHKTIECKGLRRCSKEIIEITVGKAKKMGRRPCKMCYK